MSVAAPARRRIDGPDERALACCEGFTVRFGGSEAGVVDEVWFGASRRPTALLVSLSQHRRAAVSVDEIGEVNPERRVVRLSEGAELVEIVAA
jgi:hypothetical protein